MTEEMSDESKEQLSSSLLFHHQQQHEQTSSVPVHSSQRLNNKNNNNGDYNHHSSSSLTQKSSSLHSRVSSSGDHKQRVVKTFMESVGHCLAITTFLTLIVGIPVLFFCMAQDKELGKDYAAFYSAGVFVMLTLPISIREITLHLTNWYRPEIQKYVVRILWMVPLYSINSWLSLRFHESSLYIDTIRDFYEAFVLISFFYFLVELLGGHESLSSILRTKNGTLGEHPSPLNRVIVKWQMGPQFLINCKNGVLQYVVWKTTATILTLFCESIGVYGEGKFEWRYTYPYLAIVTNFSQMYALYCLIKFYFATEEELKAPIDWKPIGKFLCIKGVIFFTWWQSVLIAILKTVGIISEVGSWEAKDVAQGLQDYLVCIEMFLFAIAHSFTYTYKEYVFVYDELDTVAHGDSHEVDQHGYSPPRMSMSKAFWSSAMPTETMKDIHRLRQDFMVSSDQKSENGLDREGGTATELLTKNGS